MKVSINTATKYGVMAKAKHPITSKARTHNRPLKKLRKMRNEARRDLSKAKRDNQGELVIQELAKKSTDSSECTVRHRRCLSG